MLDVTHTQVPDRVPVDVSRSRRRRRPNGRTTRIGVRWVVGVVVVLHGIIHLAGAVKGFGWATVSALHEPISAATGAVWLAAGLVTIAAGVLFVRRTTWWWAVGAVAVVVSEAVIATSWSDARAGTIVNLGLLLAVVQGWAWTGPRSFGATYRRRVASVLVAPLPNGVVTDAEVDRLPAPVAAYVRWSGAVGLPHVINVHARFHGRIRGGPDTPWMTFTGEQVNTYGAHPARLFAMDATLYGMPIDVLHEFVAGAATMRVKACSLVSMVDASGPDLDRAETVTVFNDMCVLAPAALVDAPIVWRVIDDHRVEGVYRNGDHEVAAELVFDDEHRLVDFVSDDRLATSADGATFTPQRWSTPISGSSEMGGRSVSSVAEGHWHPPAGEYCYLEYRLDQITCNSTRAPSLQTPG